MIRRKIGQTDRSDKLRSNYVFSIVHLSDQVVTTSSNACTYNSTYSTNRSAVILRVIPYLCET
jgi:hypothetical protein